MQEQVCYFDQLSEKMKSAITYTCVPMKVKLLLLCFFKVVHRHIHTIVHAYTDSI